MARTPSEVIEAYLEAFQKAYPGKSAPGLTYASGWFRIKEKGEHAGKLREEDVEALRKSLVKVVNAREFDLTSIAGIAAASDQAYRAAKAFLDNHLQPRISKCETIEQLRELKLEVNMECIDSKGFSLPFPGEFDLAFMMHVSAIKAKTRE